MGEHCTGQNLSVYADHYQDVDDHFNLQWLVGAYEVMGTDTGFFIPYFEKLAGTGELRKQIASGTPIDEITASWQKDLDKFKLIRKKYLIYEDFE